MNIIVFSGEKQVGKTSFLREFIGNKSINGVLSSVIEGKRFFINKSERLSCMESEGKEASYEVGKYRFSKKAFREAADYLWDYWQNPDYKTVVLDELGPLELMNKGFYGVMKLIMKNPKEKNLVLVVRAGLVEDIIEKFGISNYAVVPFVDRERLMEI